MHIQLPTESLGDATPGDCFLLSPASQEIYLCILFDEQKQSPGYMPVIRLSDGRSFNHRVDAHIYFRNRFKIVPVKVTNGCIVQKEYAT